MKSIFVIALVSLLATCVVGDLYMQNPRGSNDRLNEANTNRNNANRLFNSQNNAKGGYCVGPPMSFYEGSLLSVQFTVQHGCQNPKLWCNLVIQYMCTTNVAPEDVRIRDGTTTDTITDAVTGPTDKDANGELKFGMHEPYQYYQDCKTRDRNKGLWIADREEEGGLNDGRASAIFTRQQNNGERFGYECNEERDYYPYWHPSPWRDVAILSQDKQFCGFYTSESQNVKAKNVCVDKDGKAVAANTEAACAVSGNTWSSVPAFGIPPPDCLAADFSRDNHLGSGAGTDQSSDPTYNWTLPTAAKDKLDCIAAGNCVCVLRLRYNISSGDLGVNGNNPQKGFIDYTSNAANSPILDDEIVKALNDKVELQMAMDTTQFFRTFEDRSHTFTIKARPAGILPLNRIFNLNVRGKRGNIVQTYPATEYDFCPNKLFVRPGDFVHFQWTGCDTNPAGNAGEGTDKTDRSNIVQVENFGSSIPAKDSFFDKNRALFDTKDLRAFFAYVGQNPANCPTYEQLLADNGNNAGQAEQDVRNCFKLNAAPQYFDGGLVRMNGTGEFHFISTRNNNFSNRDQRGVIITDFAIPVWGIAVAAFGGFVCLASGAVAGAMFYAKSHPHSGVASLVAKF